MSQGMTPEFAAGLCAMMLDGIQREAECTKRVLAAVPDDKSDYRPDPTPAPPANSRGTLPTPTSSSSTASPT